MFFVVVVFIQVSQVETGQTDLNSVSERKNKALAERKQSNQIKIESAKSLIENIQNEWMYLASTKEEATAAVYFRDGKPGAAATWMKSSPMKLI